VWYTTAVLPSRALPVFSPKDKIADWLEMYTKVMELNYWGARVQSACSRPAEKEWTVEVVRTASR